MIHLIRPPVRGRNPRGRVDLAPGKRLVVVSPHLDDAALSLGATLADASREGAHILSLSVFAGDPHSHDLPSEWDRKAGFSSAGAAARRRRAEDAAACALIGMEPRWLSFPDSGYESDRRGVWSELKSILPSADLVLVPGFPLSHPDHRLVSRIVLEHADELPDIGFYVEQPYGDMEWFSHRRLPGDSSDGFGAAVHWIRVRPSPWAWTRKQRALRSYRSQLRAFTRPASRMLARIALYELGRGGEGLGFLVKPV